MRVKPILFGLATLTLGACGQSQPDGAATPSAQSPAAEASATEAPAAAASADPAAATGEPPAAFATCRACHSVEKGKNGVGPTLFAIVGTKAGDVPGYSFSTALKASGIVWDRENLDTWLQGPMEMVPGTKMVISVPNAEARKAIIDYLETLK